jgi:hypothetical protein
MAERTERVIIKANSNDDFQEIIMEALGNLSNFSVSIKNNTAECNEISAPMVGMGFNKWRRGRAYSTIFFDIKTKTVTVTTTINGLTGAAFNGKYANEICSFLISKITFASNKFSKKENHIDSVADELLKFKKLCDEGIISQEEFEAKKKQMLGL